MNLTLNITADIGGHTVHCGQVNLSVPDELVMQLVPPPPAEPGPSIWASVEQAEPVVMVRDDRSDRIEHGQWLRSAQYARYGKRVIDAVRACGRFHGTAAELQARTRLDVQPRLIGPSLHRALGEGQLMGTVTPKRAGMPCVYDVWAPVADDPKTGGLAAESVQATAASVVSAIHEPGPVQVSTNWMQSGWYQRHGHMVMEAMQRVGRFHGTALELKHREKIPTDQSNVAAALCKALETGHLLGTRSDKKQGAPTKYDVWVPGYGQAVAEPAAEVAPIAAELPYVLEAPAVPMTEAELREAVVTKLRKGQDFDGTDVAFFWRIVGRGPAGDELGAMRAALQQMDRERRIDFAEIAREGAPALWEVFA
jgi:hypothetical protein